MSTAPASGIIFVIAGMTSNLFATFLRSHLSANMKFIGLVRPGSKVRTANGKAWEALVSDPRITIIDGESTADMFERVYCEHHAMITHHWWLSTHDDIGALRSAVITGLPCLAIGSGAVMSFYLGKQTEDQLSPYARSKFAMCNLTGLTVFNPGYYIEDDVASLEGIPPGLHTEKSEIIFADQQANPGDEEFWGRKYSITPKSLIHACLARWVHHSGQYASAWYIVSSDREYSRAEIRSMSGVDGDRPKLVKRDRIYAPFEHVQDIDQEELTAACKRARKVFYS